MAKPSPREQFISNKIKTIENEGIRGKKVPIKQAVAVAYSYARKKK
jgi:hypothetical protein